MLDTKKVPFSKIVKSQLPSYVREEFPLIGEFLTQYYFGQEVQGGTLDLIQNIVILVTFYHLFIINLTLKLYIMNSAFCSAVHLI